MKKWLVLSPALTATLLAAASLGLAPGAHSQSVPASDVSAVPESREPDTSVSAQGEVPESGALGAGAPEGGAPEFAEVAASEVAAPGIGRVTAGDGVLVGAPMEPVGDAAALGVASVPVAIASGVPGISGASGASGTSGTSGASGTLGAAEVKSGAEVSQEGTQASQPSLAALTERDAQGSDAWTLSESRNPAIAPFAPTAIVPIKLAGIADALLVVPPTPSAQTTLLAQASTPQPATPPSGAPTGTPPTGAPSSAPEARVLVAEVQVEGVQGNPAEAELTDAVYGAIRTRPGLPTTSTQLQADLNAVFATGYFANVDFEPQDTPLGVRITFKVTPNPVLTSVVSQDATILPKEVIEETFRPQYGKILNFNDLQAGVKRINTWYQDQGYVLAQVVDATKISPDGQVNLVIAEGIVDSIQVKFLNAEGNPTDAEGNPVRGRTKDWVVTREFSLQPGSIFNRNQAEKDLQRLGSLGIFQDVRLSLDPAPNDPRKVVIVANVIEGSTRSIGASGGVSSSSGLFGSLSLGLENFRGRNQKLRTEITLGQKDFLFDLSFTDPWLKNDPYRTSMTANVFRRRSTSLVFSGGDRDIDLPNGDTPRILRIGGGVLFSRPLSRNVFEPAEWSASLGGRYERIAIRDSDGDNEPQDELGNDLTFSGDDWDDLVLLQAGLARDRRNNRLQPTAGSLFRVNMEQSIPIGSGSILMNRLRSSYTQYVPLQLVKFTEGCRKAAPSPEDCPQTLAVNVQAGTILGDLPPYEAFSLGGSNSVRGWGEGEIGSGRTFMQIAAEYRFPLFSFVGGALFADYGTDLGSGNNVPGRPAEVRDKPGSGYGIGLGVRIRSPLGPIRADYSVLTEGDTRFQFGIGERF